MLKKFTDSHEWVHAQEGIGTIGITDYAQKELGEVVFISLPDVGQEVEAHSESVVVESTKAAADIYAPVSGEVIEINMSLKEDPKLINRSAETEGWLFKVKLRNPEELQSLMTQQEYDEMIT